MKSTAKPGTRAPLPEIFFGLSPSCPVGPGDALWRRPLPLSRRDFLPNAGGWASSAVRYADYFNAAGSFLERGGGRLLSAASAAAGRPVQAGDIESIAVYLEKHGACYHPARVVAAVGGRPYSFVLNVAVTPAGRRILRREYGVLKRLAGGSGDLPRVYALGRAPADSPDALWMFLGEWFDGYHEFHLTSGSRAGEPVVGIWEPGGVIRLDAELEFELYRQAARILTRCYDPASTRHIAAWSHAAGDFVVRLQGGRPAVKLITARAYTAMFSPPPQDAAAVLEALLTFFLDLSVRMRLDRLDGVGDTAWAPGVRCVEGVLTGFFEALAEKPAAPVLFGAPPAEVFWDYLAAWSVPALVDFAHSLLAQQPRSPDSLQARQHLSRHVAALLRAVHGR